MSTRDSPPNPLGPSFAVVGQWLAALEAALLNRRLNAPAEASEAYNALAFEVSTLLYLLTDQPTQTRLGLVYKLLFQWLPKADNLSESNGNQQLLDSSSFHLRFVLGSIDECNKLATTLNAVNNALTTRLDVTGDAPTENADPEKAAAKASAATVPYDEFTHPIASVLFEGISEGRGDGQELRLRLGGVPRARSGDDSRSLDLLIQNSWEEVKGWLPVRLHSKPTDEMKASIDRSPAVGKAVAVPPLKKRETNSVLPTPRSSFASSLRSGMLNRNVLKRAGSKLKGVFSLEKKKDDTFFIPEQNERTFRRRCHEPDSRPLVQDSWRIVGAESHSQIYDHLTNVDPVFQKYLHHFEFDGSKRWLLHKHDAQDRYEREQSLGDLAYRMRWGENQKMAIFFHLAHALSCYYESRWLTGHWDADNICFFSRGSRVPCEPWLRLVPTTPSAKYKASDKIRHPQVLELAILSLELEIGQPIAEFLQLPAASDTNGRWGQASMVWAESLQRGALSIASDPYRQAIDFCLRRDHVKDPVVLRRMLWNHVVMPLRASLSDKNMASMDLARVPEPTVSQCVNAAGARTPFTVRASIDAVNMVYPNAVHESAGPCFGKSVPYHTGSEYPNGLDKVLPDEEKPTNGSTRLPYRVAAPPHAADGGTATRNRASTQSKHWIDDFVKLVDKHKEMFPDRRVKVALLDTGIDTDHLCFKILTDEGAPHLDPRIKEILCLVDPHEDCETRKDCDKDKCGHGTSIASLLLQLGPFIELYVARVSETTELDIAEGSNIAKALRYAKDTWDVDIVNLSLGYKGPIREIEEALDYLTGSGKQVLVFAAAANCGPDYKPWFPASCRSVFGVYSTNAIGKWSDHNPSQKIGHSLAILGEDIESSCLTTVNGNNTIRCDSGTSYATAVAVSLAAFLFAVVPCIVPDYDECYYKVDRIEGMERLLGELAQINQDKRDFLYPNLLRYFRDNNDLELISAKFRLLLTDELKQDR